MIRPFAANNADDDLTSPAALSHGNPSPLRRPRLFGPSPPPTPTTIRPLSDTLEVLPTESSNRFRRLHCSGAGGPVQFGRE